VSATPKNRQNAVERAPTEAASRSSRVPPVPSSATPIYDGLLHEMFPEWPDYDPDPPTERFPAVRLPDEWFDPLPEVGHQEPMRSLFRENPMVDVR
jgi:hypothetical protein